MGKKKKCLLCPYPAVVLLKTTVDGVTFSTWDPYCLQCAEKCLGHWRKNKVTWRKRPASGQT